MSNEAKIRITAANETDAAFRKALDNVKSLQESVTSLKEKLVAGLAFGGFTLLVKGAIDAADTLHDLSQKTGIAVESLGGLGFAASQSGGNLESVTAAAGKLNKSIAEAAAGSKEALQPFEALGIAVVDASGKTKSADTVFAEIADAFQGYADGPEKAALALRLFGKAGADQIALLNEGGDALRANIEYYKRYSGVTQEVTDQADKFNDTLEKIHLISQSLATTIAAALLPPMQVVAEEFLAMKENGSGFAVVGKAVRIVFDSLSIAAAELIFFLQSSGREIGALAAKAVALSRLDFNGFNAISTAVSEDIKKASVDLEAFKKKIRDAQPSEGGDKPDGASGKKPRAPRLPSLEKEKKDKKDPITEAQSALASYVNSLNQVEQKTLELTEVQKALDFLKGLGSTGEIPQVRELVLGMAGVVDQEKMFVEYKKKEKEINDQLAAQLKSMLDATPTAKLEKQREDMKLLVDAFESGSISEKVYLEAVTERLDLVAEKTKESKSLVEELGLTFTSAFEDAISGGKSLQEVLKGLEQDIMKIVTRKLVTEPLGSSLTGMLNNFLGSATSSGGSSDSGLGSIMGFFSNIFGGARADGGSVYPGKAYLVGERGPEIVMPKGAATVLPSGAGGGNVVSVTVNQSFAPGTDRRTLLQAAADASRQLQLAGRNL